MKEKEMVKMKRAFETKERDLDNIHIQSGCPSNCKYSCAEAAAIRFKRETPDNREGIELRPNTIDKEYRKKESRIMLPGSHDITPENPAEKEDPVSFFTEDRIFEIYNRYGKDPMVKRKDSIKTIVRIPLEDKAGLDI
jgi:hypothetical protein